MGLKAEEIIEPEDPIVDILTPEAPSRALCPDQNYTEQCEKALADPGIHPSPTARGVECKYFVSSKDMSTCFLIRSRVPWWSPQLMRKKDRGQLRSQRSQNG